eukprot:5784344-Pleurochrysis_carterae.AAC.1
MRGRKQKRDIKRRRGFAAHKNMHVDTEMGTDIGAGGSAMAKARGVHEEESEGGPWRKERGGSMKKRARGVHREESEVNPWRRARGGSIEKIARG